MIPGPEWLWPVVGALRIIPILLWPLSLLVYLVAGVALALAALIERDGRARRIALAVSLLVGVGVCFALARPLNRLRVILASGVSARARPLTDALEAFKRDQGRYPGALDKLVPAYIARVPQTGMLGYREFEYQPADPGDVQGRGAWLAERGAEYDLSIRCSWGFVNFDSMHYWPKHNYPEKAWGGVIERVDGWAYVHE